MKYIVVFITAPSAKEANDIANELIDKEVAACVNLIKGVKSVFTWQGKKAKASEVLLIVKTRLSRFAKLKRIVKRLHSYQVPEIIAMPIVEGETRYLKWISEVVR